MKSFSFFVFLNLLIFFVYAQNQTIPATITCEQSFALNGTTCTPCQQAIFNTTQPPTAKCNVLSILLSHLFEGISFVPDASGTSSVASEPDLTKAKDAVDKTCAETDACSESIAKSAYTEVNKACDTELNQYFSVNGTGKEVTPPYITGTNAALTVFIYYSAIPFRENLCIKVGGEYCFIKSYEQANQTQLSNVTNPFGLVQCDDCSKQKYDNIKNFLSSHPLDTPNLQKIMANSTDELQSFEQKCPNLVKSNAQKLINQFYNYPGIILIGLVGFIYVTFI
ncbi:hypothetical protein RclHR1_00230024 [Rhizophagus clarus]|uniref:Transmembrane protein n=1 Tax=Rhizophagus clarus TaxID=94130 RepID=A0A2Z6RPH5_9GLOM|nr:hypothetical protein RclHR1_00230024 [Rhizophagus clarus]